MGTFCNIETARLLLRPLTDEEWTMLVDRVSEAEESLFQFGIEADVFHKEMVAKPYREAVRYYAIVLTGSDTSGSLREAVILSSMSWVNSDVRVMP